MTKPKVRKNRKPAKTRSPWPFVALAFVGLLLVGAAVVFSQSARPKATIQVTGKAALRVDKEKVDLGDVKLGQEVFVAFDLTNVGDQPLQFSEAPYVEVLAGC